MTIAELIEELKKHDPDASVAIVNAGGELNYQSLAFFVEETNTFCISE